MDSQDIFADDRYDRPARPSRTSRSSRPSRSVRQDNRGRSRFGSDYAPADAFAPTAQPRAAVTRFDEEDEDDVAEPGLMGKIKKFRHDRVKSKAERKFNRQFEGDAAAAGESGPRAALYKGEMGQNHRRAARMHDEESGRSRPRAAVTTQQSRSEGFSIAGVLSSRGFIAFGTLVACLVLSCVFLYPTAQKYYVAVRHHDQMAAELAAVNSRNQELVDEVRALGTAEGVEDRARQEYGWVLEGENSVYVQGVSEGARGSRVSASVAPGSVKAPETWYSSMLDPIFGVE